MATYGSIAIPESATKKVAIRPIHRNRADRIRRKIARNGRHLIDWIQSTRVYQAKRIIVHINIPVQGLGVGEVDGGEAGGVGAEPASLGRGIVASRKSEEIVRFDDLGGSGEEGGWNGSLVLLTEGGEAVVSERVAMRIAVQSTGSEPVWMVIGAQPIAVVFRHSALKKTHLRGDDRLPRHHQSLRSIRRIGGLSNDSVLILLHPPAKGVIGHEHVGVQLHILEFRIPEVAVNPIIVDGSVCAIRRRAGRQRRILIVDVVGRQERYGA